jgi:hypothetical protein
MHRFMADEPQRLATIKTVNLELFILTFILTYMASVVKRKKSKYWTACFTNHDGRQLKRSTKTTDRNQALEIAIELERIETRTRKGELTTTHLRTVLNTVAEKVTGDTLVAPSTETYLKEWLDGVRVRARPATLERYQSSVKLFLASLGDKAHKPITAGIHIFCSALCGVKFWKSWGLAKMFDCQLFTNCANRKSDVPFSHLGIQTCTEQNQFVVSHPLENAFGAFGGFWGLNHKAAFMPIDFLWSPA